MTLYSHDPGINTKYFQCILNDIMKNLSKTGREVARKTVITFSTRTREHVLFREFVIA